MLLGMAYHPEYWPKERWPIDARLMAECHIASVRMGEFSWYCFEPQEGKFDFSWMDEAVETLAAEGITTIMCTPTATPPAWLTHAHPEVLPVDANGLPAKRFGSRRHYCPSVPVFQEHSRRIVEALAEHYGHHEAVIGWQLDNELGNVYLLDKGRCYCESCRQRFVHYLRSKYGSLDRLNEAWGLAFWSQQYSDWDQIVLPQRGTAGESLHPSHMLDYYRCWSETWGEYAQLQADIIRQHAPEQWISTNFACGLDHSPEFEDTPLYPAACCWFPSIVDWGSLSRHLDFPGWSSHVRGVEAALSADYLRGLKTNGKFAVLEGGGSRLGSYQPIAHGSLGLAPFTWRRPLWGAESGMD